MIKELRKFNSNLSYGDYDDRTMLHISVAENHLDVVKYLISICKVDINAYDWRGFTPMAEALFNRNKEMLFYL
jgi:ankyrin repeat protein